MLRPRITPCLLVHKGGLVKTVGFKAPKYVGDPINAVRIFNEKEADELIVLDIDASVSNAEPEYRMISNLAAECRMPLCYGGGIKSPEQANQIISLGVEKVAISSAAVDHPELITKVTDSAWLSKVLLWAKKVVSSNIVVEKLLLKGITIWCGNNSYRRLPLWWLPEVFLGISTVFIC